jgi:disulfide bond formation protein DsbB
MPPVPSHLAQSFLAIVAGVAALFVVAQARLGQRLRGVLVVAAYLGITGAVAQTGVLWDFSRMPPPMPLLLVACFAVTVALAFSPLGTQLVERTPIAWLIGYQAFRFPLELWLHAMSERDRIGVQLTWSGLNFDVATGASALAVALYALRAPPPRWLVAAWNWLGFALLLNIGWIAVASFPTPLRIFPGDNAIVATFPYVWLPAFLVQAALFGHVLVFRWLARERHTR